MNVLKMLVAGAAVGVIAAAFWDFENRRWLQPAGFPLGGAGGGRGVRGPWGEELEPEPILGYDGMDQDTLIEWLGEMELDRDLLQRIQRYETRHRDRETVLSAISDLMG